MARVKRNVIIQRTSGSVGKQVVLKHYGNVTITSNFPDMSRVDLTSKQKEEPGNRAQKKVIITQ
jgi:hypothetical protein